MQSNTSGDTYNFELVQSDGVTPLSLTGVQSVVVAIQAPTISPNPTPGPNVSTPVTISGNTATFVTRVFPTATFPVGGLYTLEFVVTYTSGSIAKSRVYTLNVQTSLV